MYSGWMDVHETGWDELQKAAEDRDEWCVRVRKITVEALRKTSIPRRKQKSYAATQHLDIKHRFTFFPTATTIRAQQKTKKN